MEIEPVDIIPPKKEFVLKTASKEAQELQRIMEGMKTQEKIKVVGVKNYIARGRVDHLSKKGYDFSVSQRGKHIYIERHV